MTIALTIALQSIALSTPAKAQQQFLTYEQAVGAAEFLANNGHYLDALLLLRQLPLDREDRYEVLFLRGLAAMELSNRALEDEVRDALLDEAVEAFYVVSSNNPGLLRPRLELARAYFMRGDDESRKRTFRIGACNPPAGSSRQQHPKIPCGNKVEAAVNGIFWIRLGAGYQYRQCLRKS